MKDRPQRILIVDDDLELRDMLRRYLTEHGFEVQALASANKLDERLRREPFDALVLDLMMPGEDGLSICRRLRSEGSTIPILMLTARGAAIDRIIGLEMGADDYLAKPFDPRELIARLNSALRRQSMGAGDGHWAGSNVIRFGPYVLNLTRMEVLRDDEVVQLSSTEFQLLRVLAGNPGRPLSREHLLDRLRGREYEALDRSLDVQVMRLRRKIEEDPSNPRFIRTVWGVGYMFVADASE
ncbi:two component transcriptional regulator, winged helix family [Pseudoxanthomonas sp. GM95]|uniref:response regulator n=1 Tax=Pseudoxanthomonas sp. GM95 TaxID=1881043 RepID=UPI0008AF6433|nr:response regulator [Pseudoxanthomonas sp. GM95]SEL08455.1 two component transcriptional regulator, winged helix family [Pseudoxanthomonas sp. GM95]